MLYVLANIDEMDSEVDGASSKHSSSDTTLALMESFIVYRIQNCYIIVLLFQSILTA